MVSECSNLPVPVLVVGVAGAVVVILALAALVLALAFTVVIVVDFGLLLEGGPLLPGVPEVTSGICKGFVINESKVCEFTSLGLSSFSGILLERMASKNTRNWSDGVGTVSTSFGVLCKVFAACFNGEFLESVSCNEFRLSVATAL